MGIIIALFGLALMVPVVMVITLCMANMVFADSLGVALLTGVLLGIHFHAHPVICILGGIAAFSGMTYLYLQEKAFKVLSVASTVIWAYLAGFFVSDITQGDFLWTAFFALLSGIIIYSLHLKDGYFIR